MSGFTAEQAWGSQPQASTASGFTPEQAWGANPTPDSAAQPQSSLPGPLRWAARNALGALQGVKDTWDGAAQLAEHAIPGLTSADAALGLPNADRVAQQSDASYQAHRQALGGTGTDWTRDIGRVVSVAPLAALAPEASPWLVGPALGAVSGATTPVTNLPNKTLSGIVSGTSDGGPGYWQQAGMNAGIGAVGGLAGPILTRGVPAIARQVLGRATGAGADSYSDAFAAGLSRNQEFFPNLAGNADQEAIVDRARTGVQNMIQSRGSDYNAAMAGLKADTTPLSMTPIQAALDSAPSGMSRSGKVINQDVVDTVSALRSKVGEWVNSEAPQLDHTAYGLDELKQAIGGIRESTTPGTAARTAADQVYHAVRGQVVDQAPGYAGIMDKYASDTSQLQEIQKGLSLGNKASADTALRKLQSVMRNNVNSNYGNRGALLDQLQNQGDVSLRPALAGQALNSWAPRGLAGHAAEVGGVVGAFTHPHLLPLLALASPKVTGAVAYGSGRVASTLPPAFRRAVPLIPGAALPGFALGSNSPVSPYDQLNRNP